MRQIEFHRSASPVQKSVSVQVFDYIGSNHVFKYLRQDAACKRNWPIIGSS